MRRIRLFGGLLGTAALVAAWACHDNTAPQPVPAVTFDAAHALARIDPMPKILDQPIFASFQGAMSSFETYFRSGGSIPDGVIGKTFVYDAATNAYVIDPTATGVLPNAVRFVLYAWDGARPASPLRRTGHVDLVRVSNGAGAPQQVEVVVFREQPFLVAADFVVMHRNDSGVNQFGIEGSATDGFTVSLIELNGTQGGADGQHHLVYDTNLSTSPAAVSTLEHLEFDQATASQSGNLELRYDGHRFTDQSVASGTELKFDDALYARVLFGRTVTDQTQYLRPDGSPLPQQEIVDLQALLERAVIANFFWINLAWP